MFTIVGAMSPEMLYARLSGSEKAQIRQHNDAGLQHLAHNGYYGSVFGDASILRKVQDMVNEEFKNHIGFSKANH